MYQRLKSKRPKELAIVNRPIACNTLAKCASEFIEKLAGQYFDVDTKYKGKKRILIIGDKNPNAPHLDGRKNNNVREVNKRI